jgi:acyl carrier protein
MIDEILKILKKIRPECNFLNATNFVENGMLDSLDLIRLVHEIEKKFMITIPGEDIVPENFNSVVQIECLIKKMINISI